MLRHLLGMEPLEEQERVRIWDSVRNLWFLLRDSTCSADLQRVVTKDHGPILDRERMKWSDVHKVRIAPEEDRESLAEKMMQELEGHFSPDIVQGFSPVARALAQTMIDDRYNPDSGKNQGDALDFDLLFVMMLPAVPCFADKRFVGRMRSARVRVADIDELNQHIASKTEHTLLGV